MTTEIQKLNEKLDLIKSDLDFLKERFASVDMVLTEGDLNSLDEAEAEFKAGKTKVL